MNAEERELDRWLTSIFEEAFKPRPLGGVVKWAARNVDVPASVSPEFPGLFDLGVSPVCDIIFMFYDSPDWDEFIGIKSSQIGFSMAAHVCLLHYAVFTGKNIALVLDSAPEAKRICKTRVQPLIKHCPAIAGKVFDDADEFSNLTLYLKGLAVFLCGALSASALANKTIGFGIADEVDNYPLETKGDSNALDLLRDRLKKVIGSKLAAFSKPKDEDSILSPEYLTGSRHRCFLPCPHCSEKAGKLAGFQVLDWDRMEYRHCKTEAGWDYEKVERETFYRCEHCSEPIGQTAKIWMIENRRWEATNRGQDDDKPKPRKMSAQISDLYSIHPKDSWGQIAVEFLDHVRKGTVVSFRRSRLGEPEKKSKIEVKISDLRKLEGAYNLGELPRPVDVILMGVDLQKTGPKWVRAGLNVNGDCYLIDYGEALSLESCPSILADPVNVRDWGDTPEEFRINPSGYKGIVDEGDGNRQAEVRRFITSTLCGVSEEEGVPDYQFYSCYGRGGLQVRTWRDMVIPSTVFQDGFPLVVFAFNDWAFKRDLYHDRIERFREFEAAERDGNDPPDIPRLILPLGCEERFLREFESEKQIFDHKRQRWIWKDPPDGPNDWPDALKMILVAWYSLRPAIVANKEAERRIAARAKVEESLKPKI